MNLRDLYRGQRVQAKAGTLLHDKGARRGDVYYIGGGKVNVGFDDLGYVCRLNPDDLEPVVNFDEEMV